MGESCPKLLDLIPKEREWCLNRESAEEIRRNGSSSSSSSSDFENKKLELRLGLPGDEIGWSTRERNDSLLSLNYLPRNNHNHPWICSDYQNLHHDHHYQNGHKPQGGTNPEKKAPVNTAVLNTSQKRAAPAPVVGWPPIRSFRKNLASCSSTKPVSEPQDPTRTKSVNEKPVTENSQKGMFVKINMDGVPIGRKVDLIAYDNYDKLSSIVDKLFRGLLAAQRDSARGGIEIEKKQEEQKAITGLLDGSGEYTLVYEDNEGDRMLVGDVPWDMFVYTVKRLRVLKSSDLCTLRCGGSKERKTEVEKRIELN